MARHYVIARYQEPIEWMTMVNLDNSNDFTIVQKELEKDNLNYSTRRDMPNVGRESSSWLWWIIANYCNLPDYVTFLQGNPLDHTSHGEISKEPTKNYERHGQLLECTILGAPHHTGLNMKFPLEIMGITPTPMIKFCMGAQFTVSRERLLQYTYEQYAQLFAYSVTEPNAPWELERCWETLYG